MVMPSDVGVLQRSQEEATAPPAFFGLRAEAEEALEDDSPELVPLVPDPADPLASGPWPLLLLLLLLELSLRCWRLGRELARPRSYGTGFEPKPINVPTHRFMQNGY